MPIPRVLGVAAAIALCAVSAPAQAPDPLRPVAWLAGCWSADGREPGSGEHWLPPAGGTMLGVSRTVKGGKTVDTEFLRMTANENGQLVYIALPSRQKETSFVLVRATDKEVVFENLQHDFPQRIIYRQVSADRMAARIEGLRAGVLRGIDFPMSRTDCRTPASDPGK